MLQETKGCFIVLDRNDRLVFCNEALNATYLETFKHYSLTPESFWLKKEQRGFDLSEFHNFVGQEIELLYKSKLNGFTDITLTVEKLEITSQTFLAVRQVNPPLIATNTPLKSSELLIDQLVSDIQAGKISVYYQPQINARTGELYGIEALSRWDRGQDTPISPDIFVALAEEFNFIAELDIWVLDQVCQQLTTWTEKGIDIPMTSVNFSPMSLNNQNTHQRIIDTLVKNNIPPDRIIIEITEGKKIDYCDHIISSIFYLSSMGIKFSLDDFGIGYSNFKRLTSLPVSQLKLDRSFVLPLPNKAYIEICLSTLSIGKKLGLSVVAEGVENTDQLEILEDLGCQVFQGYLFSKPLPEAEFENWFYHNHKF
ncbi:Oxygen sensor protein DosP [Marinomonas aquimarina]|uniref:Oxygen sensor protein DosP n=2 Tax=Marinomonas aquimarina TaxID=295068 RepID=A0A1A8TE68_9GAMM|nr:Oxygen sensor protein DosP [Marinomonas aquimarina]